MVGARAGGPFRINAVQQFTILILTLGVIAAPVSLRPLAAQNAVREQTALKFIPADASVFSTSLRLRQQFDALVQSRAFAKLHTLPAVQAAVAEFYKTWNAADNEEARAQWNAFWGDPANQPLIALLQEAVSQEIFFYSDASAVEFLRKLQELNVSVTSLQLSLLGGSDDPLATLADSDEVRAIFEGIQGTPFPDFVLGFKLTDVQRARDQLARLEATLNEALQPFPSFAGRLKREQIGGTEFLTLNVDGSQVPWDELLKELKEKEDAGDGDSDDDDDDDDAAEDALAEAAVAKIIEHLKTRKLAISLGVKDGYLLLSLGDTNEHLVKFGGTQRLVDRPELAPVLKAADKPLVSISFISQELSAVIENSGWRLDRVVDQVQKLGSKFGLEADVQTELIADLKRLEAESASLRSDPSAQTDWSYLTPNGYAGFSYTWKGDAKRLNGSQPLSILNHIGSAPLIAVADRRRGSVERYQSFVKGMEILGPWFEELIETFLPLEVQGHYERIKNELAPLPGRFDATTRSKLIPSLADGQSAFVLEGSVARNQWHELMPAAITPLPFPAPALVYGVTDAPLLRQASGEYFDLIQELFNAASRLYPEFIPPIVVPGPAERDLKPGTLFAYSLTGEEGTAEELAACAALSKDTAVLSFMPDQARRFLATSTGRFLSEGLEARRGQPAATAWYINIAGLVDLVRPWLTYGFEQQAINEPDDAVSPADQEQILTLLDLVKCFRTAGAISYFDGPALIEFHELVIQDIP